MLPTSLEAGFLAPGSTLSLYAFPELVKTRVARTDRGTTLRLQWRDRAGIRPASLLPSFYGGTLSDGSENSLRIAPPRPIAGRKKRARFSGALESRSALLRVGTGLDRVLLLNPGVEPAHDGLGGNAHLLQGLRRTGASVFGRSGAVEGYGLAQALQFLRGGRGQGLFRYRQRPRDMAAHVGVAGPHVDDHDIV